jgi:hypothetical protein
MADAKTPVVKEAEFSATVLDTHVVDPNSPLAVQLLETPVVEEAPAPKAKK